MKRIPEFALLGAVAFSLSAARAAAQQVASLCFEHDFEWVGHEGRVRFRGSPARIEINIHDFGNKKGRWKAARM